MTKFIKLTEVWSGYDKNPHSREVYVNTNMILSITPCEIEKINQHSVVHLNAPETRSMGFVHHLTYDVAETPEEIIERIGENNELV